MKLSAKIKEIRHVLRCTQKELAEKIQVNKTRIVSLENGVVLGLTVDEVEALVKLGINRQWILYSEGDIVISEASPSENSDYLTGVHIRLKEIRTKLEVTQLGFCNLLGVTQSQYSGYETGRIGLPYTILIQLIKNFNINANWFLTGEGSMFNQPYEQRPGIALLREIILGLERGLRSIGTDLSPESKAEIILLYYSEYMEETNNNEEDDKIIHLSLAKDILRSIKTRNIK